jgi:hypothetical protein
MSAIMKARYEEIKLSWEQIRTTAFYTMISQNGTKYLKSPEALFKFSWDQKKETGKRDRSLKEYKEFADKLIKGQV